MKNKFLALVFICFSFWTLAQEQSIHIKSNESGKSFIYNANDYQLIATDSLDLDVKSVMTKIKSSDLSDPDIELMIRIIDMQRDEAKRCAEIMNLGKAYREVDRIIMEEYYLALEKKFGVKKLKKLLKKK